MVNDRLEALSRRSSHDGVKLIFVSHSKRWMTFFTLVFIVSTAVCFSHIALLIQAFLKYDVMTEVRVSDYK